MNNQRILKFRVWDKLFNKWGNPSDFLGIDVRGNLICENGLNPTNSIVQQFTGLLDKNGKEIYEGDIIKFFCYGHYDKELIGKIIYNEEMFMFLIQVGISDLNLYGIYKSDNKYYEIIGNIFENPKLLNKNEK